MPLVPLTGVACALACATALAATELFELERGLQQEIARRCLPAQYREGAAAYRNCVTEEAALRAAAGTSALDALSFDERYAVQRSCAAADSAESRAACIESELESLDGVPDAYLGAVDSDERNAVRRECAAAQEGGGAADYRRCLGDALAALETLPSTDLTALPLGERVALARRCTADGASAADYRRCLLGGDGVAVAVAVAVAEPVADPAPLAVSEGPDTAPQVPPALGPADAGTVTDAQGATEAFAAGAATVEAPPGSSHGDSDGDGEAGTAAGSAGGEANGTGESGPSPGLLRRADDAWTGLRETVAGLDGVERIVLGAALGLPPLLLIGWAAMRRSRRRSEAAEPDSHRGTALRDRLDRFDYPGEHAGEGRTEDPLEDVEDGERLSLWPDEEELDDTVPNDLAPAAAGIRGEMPAGQEGDPHRDEPSGDDPPAHDPGERHREAVERDPIARDSIEPAPFEPRSSFGRWLLTEDETLRRQRAIELLIYWMAYGDERYAPETRVALLRDGGDDGDPHDLIKRWVLERDVLAFGDTVRWLQANTDELQRMQIVDLLMVLLITGEAVTPVQNTLLRFLADAFGLGAATLEERHEIAFGRPLPALPRVDLPAWWDGTEPARVAHWDMRALAALDVREQCRVRLGLPLDGEVGEREILEGFRRAARRCHPHRFDALGEREQALAERQFGKYEQARDRLLGVGV